MTRRPRLRANAFTLVELLVVVGIIAVLIGILIPVLTRAKDSANAVKCQSNQRQLMTAFLAFATDHQGFLPGNKGDRGNPVKWKQDWLFGSVSVFEDHKANIDGAPNTGTIFPYLKDESVYRCPSLVAVRGAGGESNGNFDYSVFQAIAGARLEFVQKAKFSYNGQDQFLPMPIILEEGANQINAGNQEGGHSNIDQFSHIHNKGTYYVAADSSVHFFVEPRNADCHNWYGLAPSGQWHQLASDESFGNWNRF